MPDLDTQLIRVTYCYLYINIYRYDPCLCLYINIDRLRIIMKELALELSQVKAKELELQTLVETIGKPGLTQCVRLLSMYVAIYKKQFGELPSECYEKILLSHEVDKETIDIFNDGMHEAISILDMVMQTIPKEQIDYRVGGITIN